MRLLGQPFKFITYFYSFCKMLFLQKKSTAFFAKNRKIIQFPSFIIRIS
ncbi:hypothetical protein CAPSP0001_2778 [Capnocytophaga sputigena ATCC 33612]|nr:hypothetical protein CAPSP0001_2778 [Capnocytophaga sputigena ATCC 33612]